MASILGQKRPFEDSQDSLLASPTARQTSQSPTIATLLHRSPIVRKVRAHFSQSRGTSPSVQDPNENQPPSLSYFTPLGMHPGSALPSLRPVLPPVQLVNADSSVIKANSNEGAPLRPTTLPPTSSPLATPPSSTHPPTTPHHPLPPNTTRTPSPLIMHLANIYRPSPNLPITTPQQAQLHDTTLLQLHEASLPELHDTNKPTMQPPTHEFHTSHDHEHTYEPNLHQAMPLEQDNEEEDGGVELETHGDAGDSDGLTVADRVLLAACKRREAEDEFEKSTAALRGQLIDIQLKLLADPTQDGQSQVSGDDFMIVVPAAATVAYLKREVIREAKGAPDVQVAYDHVRLFSLDGTEVLECGSDSQPIHLSDLSMQSHPSFFVEINSAGPDVTFIQGFDLNYALQLTSHYEQLDSIAAPRLQAPIFCMPNFSDSPTHPLQTPHSAPPAVHAANIPCTHAPIAGAMDAVAGNGIGAAAGSSAAVAPGGGNIGAGGGGIGVVGGGIGAACSANADAATRQQQSSTPGFARTGLSILARNATTPQNNAAQDVGQQQPQPQDQQQAVQGIVGDGVAAGVAAGGNAGQQQQVLDVAVGGAGATTGGGGAGVGDEDEDFDVALSPVNKAMRFSSQELQYLVQGVQEIGPSKWKLILNRFNFHPSRDASKLKDKWRNMVLTVKHNRKERIDPLPDDIRQQVRVLVRKHQL